MKNLKYKLIGLFLIVALFSLNINLFGQQGYGMGQGNGYGRGNLCNNIPNLTIEQSNRIEKLRIEYFKERQANYNLLGEKRAHLQTLRSVDNANMVAINNIVDEVTVLQGTMSKQHEQHIQDVRNLLDDDQKVYYDNFKRGRGNGQGNGRGYGQGYGRGQGNRGCRGNGRGYGRGNW